jgi:hypothetical protein
MKNLLILTCFLVFSFSAIDPAECYIQGQVDYAEGRIKIKPEIKVTETEICYKVDRGYIDPKGVFWVTETYYIPK